MAESYARKPRILVNLAGIDSSPMEASISTSSHRNADTFSATLALDAVPGLDERFFADSSSIPVIITATNDVDAGSWVTMFTGTVDVPAINWMVRRVIITGRDKSQALIETKTTEKWLNKTSEEIVNDIASRVGLTADVSIENPDKVGLITKDDYNRISNQDVLWNVLTVLADREGCAVFVKQDRLIFKPIDNLGGGVLEVMYQRPTPESFASGNFINLSTSRNLSVSKNVKVSVKSWQQKQKKAINSAFSSSGKGSDKLDYTYRVANATKQQADKIAKGKIGEITGRERLLDIDMPGDVNASPEQTLSLFGTGTTCDQDYIISEIAHRWEFESGYRMTINARNKDKSRTITQDE